MSLMTKSHMILIDIRGIVQTLLDILCPILANSIQFSRCSDRQLRTVASQNRWDIHREKYNTLNHRF